MDRALSFNDVEKVYEFWIFSMSDRALEVGNGFLQTKVESS